MLQETAHRAGLNLPVYTTIRSGPGHVPVFSCTVELAGLTFAGEPARTKKQAQKNAALAAWSALKRCMHYSFCYLFIFLLFNGDKINLSFFGRKGNYVMSSIYVFGRTFHIYVGISTSLIE